MKFWGNLIPVDVFASDVAKMLQGSSFRKIPKIGASMGSAGAIVAQILGILEKFDPCQCLRISSFRNFGEI